MENYILLDDVSEEGVLTLVDGSCWEVNPGHIPTAICWSPTARIKIEKGGTDTFDHTLTNLESNQQIRALAV